jgi:hypothetical protein
MSKTPTERSVMNKKIIGILVIVATVLAIGLVAWSPWSKKSDDSAGPVNTGDLKTVTGVIGSEKSSFFKDEAVIERFAKLGYQVKATTAGSREIATTVKLDAYDFAFPSSTAAATKLEEVTGANKTYDPFYSPMAVATWTPILQQLQKIGVATQTDGVWYIDVPKYLETTEAGTRWSDIEGAADTYNSSRSILIGSTNISTSNSAAMYASIASYVLNGNNVLSTPAEEEAVAGEVASLFSKQGFTASSSAEPFNDYLTQGIGARPLVMVYEQQFVEQALRPAGLPNGATIAYLSPTVLSKHVVVPLTDNGDKVGELISTDAELQKLAAAHGFRTTATEFSDTVAQNQIAGINPNLTNIADVPSFDTLEKLISDIVAVY